MPSLDSYLHHTRAEIQGTSQLLFAEDAVSLADARLKGFLDYGNFLGNEIKTEPKREAVVKARRGVLIQAGTTAGLITLGVELMTKEVADSRKAIHLLSAKAGTDLTQAALAAQAVDALAFSGPAPAILNRWYEVTYGGINVREISALTVAGLVEGTDFVVDKKLGLIRFIKTATLPAVATTPTVTADLIGATTAGFMKGFNAMQKSAWRGWARIPVWDQDTGNNLVMDYEARPVEITLSGGTSIDGEKQAELKLMVWFTDNLQRVLVRD